MKQFTALFFAAALIVIIACSFFATAVEDNGDELDAAITTHNTPYEKFRDAVQEHGLERAVHLFAPEQPGASEKCSVPPLASTPDYLSDPNKCMRVRLTAQNHCCWLSRKGEVDGVGVVPDYKGLLPLECCHPKNESAYDEAECRMILPKICELLHEVGHAAAEEDDEFDAQGNPIATPSSDEETPVEDAKN